VLADKPRLAAANKIDALDEPDRLSRLRARLADTGIAFHPISAVTGEGVQTLLEAMWRVVADGRQREAETARDADGDRARPVQEPR